MRDTTHEIAVPGQIDFGTGVLATFTISELSEKGCRICGELPRGSAFTQVTLWLGAIGPLRGHVNENSASEIEFDGDINPMIVEHFCS